MPDLLLELFSEEIPARMQTQAADDLKKLVTNALVDRGLTYEGAAGFSTPRRLTLHIAGLPLRQPDLHEEIRGPRVGSPEAALAGFLKKAGLTAIEQAKVVPDGKKGEVYVAHIHRAGQATVDVLAEILPNIIRNFPWPKSMRWGVGSSRPDTLRWVRPLHSILCTFGPETEETQVVDFAVDGIRASNITYGHRFMAPAEIKVRRFADYVAALEKAKVILDPARRREIILNDAKTLAFAHGLELVEDDALLHEVAGLVEWPVVLLGAFEPRFLDIPAEVVRATIRANQKCFVLRDASGSLAPRFLLTSNIVASDGGTAIAAGNGRVVRARLSDALYFWQTDQAPLPDFDATKPPLDQRLEKLRALNIVFHEKLGTQGARIDRMMALAVHIAPIVGADPSKARRAAELAKADLVTEVVGEFPEVQGLMGRRYAELQGEDADVCAAIEEHYKPQGPSDFVPKNPVSIAVALADKLDTLVGFWAIDEKPTGSKDPFALRRAALGVVRLVLENGLNINLARWILRPLAIHEYERYLRNRAVQVQEIGDIARRMGSDDLKEYENQFAGSTKALDPFDAIEFFGNKSIATDLLAFFHDRLKVYLRDQGTRHDVIDAVLSPEADDVLAISRRAGALQAFLDTEDGKNLLAGFKRAANILKAEEKKFPTEASSYLEPLNDTLLSDPAEKALADALSRAAQEAAGLLAAEDYAAAMQLLSTLRAPTDAFFTDIMVNDENPSLRLNRLRLLNALRVAVQSVADFSKIVG